MTNNNMTVNGTREIPKRIVETVRIQYASGLYDIPKLIERWYPEITILELDVILAYNVNPEVHPQLRLQISQMEGLFDDLEISLGKQEKLIRGLIDNDDELGTVEALWIREFQELSSKYSWLTWGIFRRARSVAL